MADESGVNDRRIFERFPVKLPLRFFNLWEGEEGEGVTEDISAKGIGMVTDEILLPHTMLELWLEMPDRGDPLYIRGEVTWSSKVDPGNYRVGIDLEKAELMGFSRILRK